MGSTSGSAWGQRLFFNQNGQRCSLTGKRKSDFLAEASSASSEATASANLDREGLNLVMLIQVPLKQKVSSGSFFCDALCESVDSYLCDAASDVEEAVIGHGKVEGPYTEIGGLDIERDERFPVRVTVQFYKATSNGVVSEEDMAEIADQINKVYRQADYVGSLIVQGETGRPTEHAGPKVEPPNWWDDFWQRHLRNTGQSKDEASAMLTELLGRDWPQLPQGDVETALRRRK